MALAAEDMSEYVQITRRFIRERIAPREEQLSGEGSGDDAVWAELIRESVDLGLYTANLPEDRGGPGFSLSNQILLWEEFGHTTWPIATRLLSRAHQILMNCTDLQWEKYVIPIMQGLRTSCFALTEPGAGSDNAMMRTYARIVPGGYRITGTKHFITEGDADIAVVMAVTGEPPPGRRTPPITAFLVNKGTPGFTIGARQLMMGWRGSGQYELIFEDCFVPDEQVLGTPGEGLRLALSSVAQRRLQIAAFCVGAMDRLVGITNKYSRERVLFGSSLAEKQGIQWMIADMVAEHIVSRETTRSIARMCDDALDAGADPLDVAKACVKEISVAKLSSTRALSRVADSALQIHGGTGWSQGAAVERLYRDARGFRIVDGPDELHRDIIYRAI